MSTKPEAKKTRNWSDLTRAELAKERAGHDPENASQLTQKELVDERKTAS